MSDSPKGRRASERRREKLKELAEGSGPESTDQSEIIPEPGDATQGIIPDRRSRTGVTSLTSVANASNEAMKQSPAEPTSVRPLDLGPELAGGRLICLDGKDVGKSFELTHDVMVVGRAKDAHLRLLDGSVSRQHFEIRYVLPTNQYFFRPLVMDPPPHINGEEVAESDRELSDGDVMEVGETTLRFVRTEAPAPAPREVPQPVVEAPPPVEPPLLERTVSRLKVIRARVRITKAMVAGFLLLVAGLGVAGFYGAQAYLKAAHQADLDSPAGAYQKLLAHTQTLRESRRWPELADTAKTLQELAPERPDAAALLREATDEQLAERNLNLGRMSFTAGNFDAARSVLRLIPDGSVYKEDRDRILERASEHGRSAGVTEIRRLLEQGKYQDAAERADHHLASYSDDQEVLSMRAQATRSLAAREASGSPTWQGIRARALAALDSGDLGGAAAIAEQGATGADVPMANRMSRQLRSLQQQWNAGRGLLARKDPKAVRPLQEARELELAVSGGRSALAKDISRALADAYYLAGVDAVASGKECDARLLFERANTERPGDGKVTDKLSTLTSRGRALLHQAQAAKAGGEHAKAVKLAKDAACRLPRGDDERAQAERLASGGR